MDFSTYIYNSILNTFSWCSEMKPYSPSLFPPFCPEYKVIDEKKKDLEEIIIEQPKKEKKNSDTDWDIICDNIEVDNSSEV